MWRIKPLYLLPIIFCCDRCIGQFEDVLRELCHELRQSEDLSPELSIELRDIFKNIRGHDYLHDRVAVRIARWANHDTPRRPESRAH
jgi:hypothetical protein